MYCNYPHTEGPYMAAAEAKGGKYGPFVLQYELTHILGARTYYLYAYYSYNISPNSALGQNPDSWVHKLYNAKY